MPDHASHERASRLTGIALMCGAVACFAMLDTTAKYLNLYMSTLQVVWARYTGAFLLPFIVSNPWTRPGLTRTTRPVLQIGRSMLLLGSTMLQLPGVALSAARRGDRAGVLHPVLRRGAVGPDAGRVGALAALDRDRRGLRGRPGGDPAGRRQLSIRRRCSRFPPRCFMRSTPSPPAFSPAPIPTRPPCSTRTSSARSCCFRSCRSSGRRRATRW